MLILCLQSYEKTREMQKESVLFFPYGVILPFLWEPHSGGVGAAKHGIEFVRVYLSVRVYILPSASNFALEVRSLRKE